MAVVGVLEIQMAADLARLSKDMKRAQNTVGSTVRTINNVLGTIGVGISFAVIGKMVKDVTSLNQRYQELGLSLVTVGRNVNISAAVMNKTADDVKKLGISMIESRQTVLKLAAAHIDLSKATQLADLARNAAIVGQTNTSDALNKLVTGINSASTVMLRNIGVNVSFIQAYNEMAKELGVTSNQLTITEKKNARLNAVLAEAPALVGLYEAAMANAGKQFRSTDRLVEDLQVKIGGLFDLSARTAISAYTGVLKDLDGQIDEVTGNGEFKQWGDDIARAMATAADTIGTFVSGFKIAGLTLGAFGAQVEALTRLDFKAIKDISVFLQQDIDKEVAGFRKVSDALESEIIQRDLLSSSVTGVSNAVKQKIKEDEKEITVGKEKTKISAAQALANLKVAESTRRTIKLSNDVERITASVATEQEKYNETLKELERLKPYLGVETYTRALQKAQEELRGVETASRGFFQNTEQFGIQAARNIQTAFASFLSGTEADFGRMIKNMVGQLASRTLLTGFESAARGGLALLSQSDATPSREASELLDLNRSSLKTNERILQSSDETASALDKIIKGAQLGSLNGEEDVLTRTAFNASQSLQNPNVLAGSLAVAGGRVLGTSDTATAIAGGLATFGGPIGLGAGAAVLAFDFLDKKFGDYELPGSIKTGADVINRAFDPTGLTGKILGIESPATLIANALFGQGPLRQKETTLSGLLGDEGFEDAELQTRFRASGSLFKSSRTDFATVDLLGQIRTDNEKALGQFAQDLSGTAKRVFNQFNEDIGGASKELIKMGENLGIGTEGVRNFSQEVELVSEKGKLLTQEQIDLEITKIVDVLAHELIPEIDGLAKSSEHTFEAIRRVNSEFDVLTKLNVVQGQTFANASASLRNVSIDDRSAQVSEAGGADALNLGLDRLIDLLEPEEQLRIFSDALQTELSKSNISSIPSLDEFLTAMTSGELSEELFNTGLGLTGLIVKVDELNQAASESSGSISNLSAANDAFDILSKSVAVRQREIADEIGLVTDRMGDLSNVLRLTSNAIEVIQPIGKSQARGIVGQAANDAGFDNPDLGKAIRALTDTSTDGFSSRIDFLRDQAKSVGLLNELEATAGQQLTIEEQMLSVLESERDTNIDILSNAQSQLDALNGIKELLSIGDALTAFEGALSSANSNSQGSSLPIASAPLGRPSGNQIRDFVNANLGDPFAIYEAAIANNVDSGVLAGNSILTRDQINRFTDENGFPRFASGGIHSGGLRIVGENGPELEFTQPSRIVSNSESKKMLDNSELEKKIDKLIGLFEKVVESSGQAADILEKVSVGGGPLLVEIA